MIKLCFLFRNQTITEFFRPVLKQGKYAFLKNRGYYVRFGYLTLCAEHFEKKVSSPKKVRRKKMPDRTRNTSPVLDAFRRRVKEKKDSANVSEDGRACKALGSLYPKVVIKKLPVNPGSQNSCFLVKKDKTVKLDQGRNEKCLGVTRAPLSCGNCWEQKTDCMDLEDTDSDSDKRVSSSEADTQACDRNSGTVNNTALRQAPGLPRKLPCTPTDSEFTMSLGALCIERKSFSGTSVSHQVCLKGSLKVEISDFYLIRIGFLLLPFSAVKKPKRVYKHEASSSNALRTSSEMAAGVQKTQSVPSCCLRTKMSSGRSKQIDFPGKRKLAAMSVDADSSNQSEVSSLNEPAFSRSPAKCKNRKCHFVKNILLKSTCGGVLQLMEAAALPRHDSSLPEEYLNSIVDTKENQLQVANSCFFLEKSPPFSQEKSAVLPSLHHLTHTKGMKSHPQSTGLSQVLDAKKEQDGKRTERCAYSIQSNNRFSQTKDETSESASGSVEGSRKLALSKGTGKSVPRSLSFKEGRMDSGSTSSQPPRDLKVESTCKSKSKLSGKSKSSFDSEDESLECNLDDDDDDEVLVPLQEILFSSSKPQAGNPEESSDSLSPVNTSPLLNNFEFYRAFIKRFSVVTHAIPDYHPGEDIFDLSASGKIFKYLHSQLSLVINGFLSSAYSCILCPIPILKWLFQVRLYYLWSYTLFRYNILPRRSTSISDEQSKPWIPSLADVSAIFINMGVAFRSLFPLQQLQPNFNEYDILSYENKPCAWNLESEGSPLFPLPSTKPYSSLSFCTTVIQGGYTDQEIMLLLLLLFKISLEKQLKRIPLIDFQCLFLKLLIRIEDWDTKMPELCLALSELSNHQHNLLWLVQLVPSWTYLSIDMAIGGITPKAKIVLDLDVKSYDCGLTAKALLISLQAYYLIYILLHLVSEASIFDRVNSNQRQHLLKLCGALDKHIKCDIREDARLFYRTKVKDLVARIYGKWQDVIQTTRPTQVL
uniref:Coiled-coil SMC6 And NSE5 INteracting (CANIN) domain-containing protein n=1 Tax=Melopsittacus undulatus TaxID=13146 RepID=A0A8V5FTM4_MELUD